MRVVKQAGMLFAVVFLLGATSLSFADDAIVLPKGVWAVNFEDKIHLPITKRYGSDGKVEDVATDFNQTLNSNIFPDLAVFEQPPFGLTSANVGKSVTTFKYDFNILNVTIGRGITDKVSVGMKVPYWWAKNNVTAKLDTTNATVGVNPLYQQNVLPEQLNSAPFLPLGFLKSQGIPVDEIKLTTEDIQSLLGPGLDVDKNGTIDIPGYGYKRFETWSGEGFGDIEVGAKYKYYESVNWRLALLGGMRFPTGRVDDPDNLTDYPFGTGAYAFLFNLNNDYVGIKDLVLDFTLRYDVYLPDHPTLRVPDDVNHPLTKNKEKVDRTYGNIFQAEVSAKYEFTKTTSASLLYRYGHGDKDKVSGSKGFNYKSLEEETNYREQIYIVGLAYTTVPLFVEKKFPVPLDASLSYRYRFAGANNVFQSEYFIANLTFYF